MKRIFDILFQKQSPLVGWFILMELLTAACLTGFWVKFLANNLAPWEHGKSGPMAVATILFVVANALLVRYRRWAMPGLILSWVFVALALLPTL